MEFTELDGIKIIQAKVFKDERGFFIERFVKDVFIKAGIHQELIQDNQSRSAPGVIRGLHYQHSPHQGKLVYVTSGKIFDVAVDLRKNSKNFGKHIVNELTADNGKAIWIPGGFAHGFCVIGDEPADVLYKLDVTYNHSKEGGIHYADADLAIQWPIKNPLVGKKDQLLPSLEKFATLNLFNE